MKVVLLVLAIIAVVVLLQYVVFPRLGIPS